jgi:DNA mismatch repair protein MutS
MTPTEKFTKVKSQVPEGMVVFFKLGSFYEAYHSDAIRIAPLISLPLHDRGGTPCVAIPYHAIYKQQDELEKKHYIKSICVSGNGDFNS